MSSRRILVTGLSKYWGARLARELERIPEVEAIIGVDSEDPAGELERTEFVRVGTQHALLRRIVQAAEIDTVIDTRLVVDSTTTSPRRAHENNVIGTMNILAACSGPDSTVRKFVFKSSAHFYGCEQDDPAFFTESMGRPHPPRAPIERDIVEAEAAVAEFAEQHPDAAVTVLRFANVLGPGVHTAHSRLFSLPVVPMILGFDPRYQFVQEDDVVNALKHAAIHDLAGVFNVAGDGVLVFSELCSLIGKPYAPILPPWGTGTAAALLRPLGVQIPPEMLHQLRFGRGLDNRRYKAAGFVYRYTTRETVARYGEHLRLRPILRGVREPYRYEREVDEFLRWSPYVRQPRDVEGPPLPFTRLQLTELRKFLAAYGDVAGPAAGRVEEAGEQAEAPPEAAAAAESEPGPAPVEEIPLAESEAAEAEPAVPEVEPEPSAAEAAEAGRPAPEAVEAEPAAPPRPPVDEYDDLEAEEIISVLGSLEYEDLEALGEYERAHRARDSVLAAIDSLAARRRERVTP